MSEIEKNDQAQGAETAAQAGAEDSVNKLYEFVLAEMQAGTPKAGIVKKLVDAGASDEEVRPAVETVHAQLLAAARNEAAGFDEVLPSVGGGIVAAIAGAVIWYLIVVMTNYEIGYMAIGIGLLCGFAVNFTAREKRGFPLQVIASVSSVASIFVAKYLTFFYFLKKIVLKNGGPEAAAKLGFFSGDVIGLFKSNFTSMLTGHDLLWVAIAVYVAWQMPRGMGIKTE